MNQIIFTGTSSGYPSKTRACSSFLIRTGLGLYQFDAGEGFSGSCLRHRLDANSISKIFITHLHPDHISGLFLELQMMYLDKRKKPLVIYAPGEAVKGLARSADLFYLFKEKFPFKFNFKPNQSNPVYRGREITVAAFPNRHLTGNRSVIKSHKKQNMMQSFSYIITLGDRRILYSGDLMEGDNIGSLMRGIHTAIVEGLHVDLKSLFDICAGSKIKHLVLTHLPDETVNRPSKIFRMAEKSGFMKLIIAYDGLRLRI